MVVWIVVEPRMDPFEVLGDSMTFKDAEVADCFDMLPMLPRRPS